MEQTKQQIITFSELLSVFNEQLERFEKNNAVMAETGHKLFNTSNDKIVEENAKLSIAIGEGVIRDFAVRVEKLRDLNTSYGNQLNKLQAVIQ